MWNQKSILVGLGFLFTFIHGVCADVKLLTRFFNLQGGSKSHSIRCPTKMVVWDCDIGTDHPDVPAFVDCSVHDTRLSREPPQQLFRLRVHLPQSELTMVYSTGLSFSPFQNSLLNYELATSELVYFSTFHFFLHGISSEFFVEDSHCSWSCLVLHAWDSVPNWSDDGSIPCLVWFPWWLQHGAMDPFEGTHLGECWPSWLLNSHILIQEFA